ncbi:MAG: hypothetical protein ACOYVK_21965 [Bacillota bacterium]
MDTEKFIKDWEKYRQKGKLRHILTVGTMMGTVLLLFSVVKGVIKGNFIDSLIKYDIYIYLTYLIGGLVGGGIGSLIRWNINEKKYNSLISRKK